MPDSHILSFGPYRIDTEKVRLWCDTQPVRLTPKAFQVLCYVVERPGQLVTKEELFRVVWADTVVGDAALTMCIQEIRKALQDNAKSPQYLETVHRQGFRFIAEVVSSQEEERQKAKGKNQKAKVEETEQEIEKLGSLDEAQRNPGEASETESRISLRSIRATELPASAGMTHPPSSPQPHNPSPQLVQTLDVSAPSTQRPWVIRRFVLLGLLLLVGIIALVQYLALPTPNPQSPTPSPQPLSLPDKPSIIVLPFINMSGDPGQDYFSDGLTEVLTTDLSKIASLFVIARNSAFTYKGKAAKVQDVGREMGVRYVLEGGVLRTDNQVRITAQLIDATTGYHLWSERYDRPFTAIFAVQDEIVQKIVTTLKLQITLQEQGYLVRKRTDSPEAYDAFLHGMEFIVRNSKEAISVQARQMFEKALALDSQYAEAYALLGATYYLEWAFRYNVDPQTLERALTLVQQALALDDSTPYVPSFLSIIYAGKQQYDQALAEGERAITLAPNDADSYFRQAHVLIWAGRPEDALGMMAQAIRLNPRYQPSYLFQIGWAYRLTGRYAEAITTLKEFLIRSPNHMAAYEQLAVNYVQQWASQLSPDPQMLAQAEAAVQRALALNAVDPISRGFLGLVNLWQKQYESALVEMEQAIALNPNLADSYAFLADTLGRVGRSEEALRMVEQALRRKPFVVDQHLGLIGSAYYLAGKPEEAIAPLKQYLARYPNILGAHLTLAAVYSELGKETEARAEAAEVLRLNPNFSLEVHKERVPIKDPATLERHIAALRKAGLK